MATTPQKLTLTATTFGGSWLFLGHNGLSAIVAGCIAWGVASYADELIDKVVANFSHDPKDNAPITAEEIAEYRRQQGLLETETQDEHDFTLPEIDNRMHTFRQLIELGVIQRMISEDRKKPLLDRRILIGYNSDKLYYVTMKSLYSCGVGGTGRTGKSTTVRWLLFQLLLLGFKLVMVDPHISHADESLAYQFKRIQGVHAMPPCDASDENLLRRVRTLHKELRRRIESGTSGTRILFVLDELNGIMRRASEQVKKELASLLLDIEQDGGKFGIYVWLIGHRWAENDLGGKNSAGVAIRTSLVSKIAHRFSDENQANCFMGISSMKQQATQLPTGTFLFLDSNGNRMQVTTPPTYAEDSKLVVSLLESRRNAPNTTPQTHKQEVHTDNLDSSVESITQVEAHSTGKTGNNDMAASAKTSLNTHINSDDDATTTIQENPTLPTDWTLEQARFAKNMYQERVSKEDILKYLGKRGTASVRRGELNHILEMEL